MCAHTWPPCSLIYRAKPATTIGYANLRTRWAGWPRCWALTGAKADEPTVLENILAASPALTAPRANTQILIGDKNYVGRDFDTGLRDCGIDLLTLNQSRRNIPAWQYILQTITSAD